jgi:hypothetical protein
MALTATTTAAPRTLTGESDTDRIRRIRYSVASKAGSAAPGDVNPIREEWLDLLDAEYGLSAPHALRPARLPLRLRADRAA